MSTPTRLAVYRWNQETDTLDFRRYRIGCAYFNHLDSIAQNKAKLRGKRWKGMR